MSVKARIWLVVLSTIISICTLSAVALFQSNSFMMYLLEDKIRSLTEVTVGVANAFNQRVESGELTLDQAKNEYRQVVHNMRYDNGQEFFFVVDYEGTFVAMGGAPELVGENIINMKDPGTGKPMTRDLIALARSGGGFYDHNWPKAGESEPAPKVAYVMGYEPWDLYVGTGLYFDNINQIFKEFAFELGMVVLALTALLSGLLYFVAKEIFNRINWIAAAMNDVASGDADLRARLDENTKDEFAQVARSFNHFIAEIQTIIQSVRTSSDQVQKHSQEVADFAFQTEVTIQEQLRETELASTAINEMSATIQEVAQTANTTSQSTKDSAKKAENGSVVVDKSTGCVHQLGEEMEVALNRISELRGRSNDIGSILEVIKGIAEQTNLLALNAAIEAARAGEMGCGFAVVADEVRNLARRTQESTTEIENIIGYLQTASVTAHESMQKSEEKLAETVKLSTQSGSVLAQIRETTLEINDMNTQVATATDEQAVVAEEVSKNVTNILSKSQIVASNVEGIKSHSESLKEMSIGLQKELEKFTV